MQLAQIPKTSSMKHFYSSIQDHPADVYVYVYVLVHTSNLHGQVSFGQEALFDDSIHKSFGSLLDSIKMNLSVAVMCGRS